jgi:dihydropteroate synthase
MAADHSVQYAPTLLGVINLSPESMVRDSIVTSAGERDARARKLQDAGVSVMDLGGRSITPDAPPIDDAEEQRRLEPGVRDLVRQGYRVSVDSWSPETAIRALSWGASFLNYTGQDLPDALLDATAAAGATLALSYMPYGNAYEMRRAARVPYRIDRILDFLGPRVERARGAGLTAPDDVVLDPNLGILHPDTDDYTKIHLQHHVLWNLDALRGLGCPLLLYAARKPERLARIMMASAVLHARPEYVRTHEPWTLQRLLEASRETEA